MPESFLHLGPAIRHLRKPPHLRKPRMTQGQLAGRLGVSKFLVCKWERRRGNLWPSDDHIRQICRMFNVSRKRLEEIAREIEAGQ